MALRLLFLTTHYRDEMNFTWQALEGSQKAYQRLLRFVETAKEKATQPSLSSTAQNFKKRFFNYLENDLKTPEAVAVMWEMIKDSQISNQEKLDLLQEFTQVLGLQLSADQLADQDKPLSDSEIPDEVKTLLKNRHQARKDKDWVKADQLRDKITKLGYQVIDDSQHGQQLFQQFS